MGFDVNQKASSTRWHWLAHVPPTIQSLFYVVGIALAILTYLQARKTFFQPLRTEVFKLQLRAVEDALHPFVGKDEAELRAYFGLESTMQKNALLMLDSYGRACFGLNID